MKSIFLPDEAALAQVGKCFAHLLTPGTIIFLNGELGVGKTTLVRHYLRGLGYMQKVKSPTYSLVEIYEIGTKKIYHFDLYRLNTANELIEIGIQEYFNNDGICFVEWPEKGFPLLPVADLDCYIEFVNTNRQIHIKDGTAKGKKIVEQFSMG